MLCKVDRGQFVPYKLFTGDKSKITELNMQSLGLMVSDETYKRTYQEVDWSALTSLRKITIDGAKFIGLNITTKLPSLEELEFKRSMIHADALENLLYFAPNIKKVNKSDSVYYSQKSFSRNKSITGKEKTLDERIGRINSQTTTEVMQTNNEDGHWINASDSSEASSINLNRGANAKGSQSIVKSNSTIQGVREFSEKNATDTNDEISSVFSGVSRDSQVQIGFEKNLFDEDEDFSDDNSSQSTEFQVEVGPKPANVKRRENSKSTNDSESVFPTLSSENLAAIRESKETTNERLGNQHASMPYLDDVSDSSYDGSELYDDPENDSVTRKFENHFQPFKLKARGEIGNFSSNSSNPIYSNKRESMKGDNSTGSKNQNSSRFDRSAADSFKGKSSNPEFEEETDLSSLRSDDQELYGRQIPTHKIQNPKDSRNSYNSSSNATRTSPLPPRLPSSSSIISSQLNSRDFVQNRNNTLFSPPICSGSVGDLGRPLNSEEPGALNIRRQYQANRQDFDIQAQGRVEERSAGQIVNHILIVLEKQLKNNDDAFEVHADEENKKATLVHNSTRLLEARSESVKVFKSLRCSVNKLSLEQKALVVLGSLGIPPCPIEGIHVDTKGKSNNLADEICRQFNRLSKEEHDEEYFRVSVIPRNGK